MITASAVKELRERTGAGMMDCKNALVKADGDMEKAIDNLRKAGIAKAEKKSGRSANDGLIMPYIHPGSKLGVMVEVNCETDFVARTEKFQTFAKDIAMHIAASNPLAVNREDIDNSIVEKEKEIFAEQAKLSGKPDHILEKIATGRMEKYFGENALMEQTFVKDSDKTIKDVVTDAISSFGENISIARFSRFELGETVANSESQES
ncbi:MAG: translation elongation factor Ts [Candidatus Marinimicrobia bacterium]|nr:translation elongation factor Ts [Candidatus Neomarinimicrobiota bacterium]